MQQIVGARSTWAAFDFVSRLRTRPSFFRSAFDHVAACRTGAGNRAALGPSTERPPRAPAGPSVVFFQ